MDELTLAGLEEIEVEAPDSEPSGNGARNTIRRGAYAQSVPSNDVWIYRLVVVVLGLVLIIASVGALMLGMADKSAPDVMVALGSGAVGALAGLLAPSPSNR